MIEIKTFLYILITNFTFQTTSDKIMKANVYVDALNSCYITLMDIWKFLVLRQCFNSAVRCRKIQSWESVPSHCHPFE